MFNIYEKKQHKCTIFDNPEQSKINNSFRFIIKGSSQQKELAKKTPKHPFPYFYHCSRTQINETAELKAIKAAFPSD